MFCVVIAEEAVGANPVEAGRRHVKEKATDELRDGLRHRLLLVLRAVVLTLTWRLATRQIFTTYFARGYRAVHRLPDARCGQGSLPVGALRRQRDRGAPPVVPGEREAVVFADALRGSSPRPGSR